MPEFGKWILAFTSSLVISQISYSQVFVDPPESLPSETLENPGISYSLAQQLVVDDNLFRLPDGVDSLQIGGSRTAHRRDTVNRTLLEIDDRVTWGEQVLRASLRGAYNYFSNNHFLNNFSSYEGLIWDWRSGALISGQLEASHDRSLLDFANTRLLAKDLLDTTQVSAKAALQLSPLWAFTGSFRHEGINHSLDESRAIDSRSEGGSFGVEWIISELASLEMQYRYTRASYPDQVRAVGSVDPDFQDSDVYLLSQYLPTDKTVVIANFGHVTRHYEGLMLPSFSGYVWHAALRWRMLEKVEISASGGRDLNAYVDAAEQYFVSTGISCKVNWTPRDKLVFSLNSSWQRLVFSVGAPMSDFVLGRTDVIRGYALEAMYAPRRWATFTFSAGKNNRGSNQGMFSYDDRVVLLSIRFAK